MTYGTTATPFLAIRSLYQCGIDNEKQFPIEARIIKEDFYVDDLLTGTDSRENLLLIKENITQILSSSENSLVIST